MIPTIPIATDHFSKFIALFGLALVISSLLATVYVYDRYFDRMYNLTLEREILKLKQNLTKDEELIKSGLDHRLNIDKINQKTFIWALAVLGGIGVVMALLGFDHWRKKVQPKQDEMLNLQIEKMKREIQVLDKQLEQKQTEDVPLS